jgi:NAD(P)-dependent dehydrogenase (short-subunit alcohol dehydrogenase family)
MSESGGNELDGRVAIVTGGGQNIGLEMASRLARHGAKVLIFDKNPDTTAVAAKAIGEAGGTVSTFVGDVANAEDFAAAVRQANDSYGVVDILVNNAGIWITKPLLRHTDEDFDRVLGTNLRGVFLGCREVLPAMMERGWGRIVNLASIAAAHYTIPHASYAASKAGVMALTRDLAYEVAPSGVTVNAIAPGAGNRTKPGGTNGAAVPGLPMGPVTPADLADTMMFLLSEGARHITGETITVAAASNIALTYGRLTDLRMELLGHS